MPEENPEEKDAWAAALRSLKASQKSRQEMLKRLREKGFGCTTVNRVLHKLERAGFIDDHSLASSLAVKYREIKPSGRRRLQFEMKRRGIPGEIREELLAGCSDEAESELAVRAAEAKLRALERTPYDKRKKRLFDYLCRRGFDYQAVCSAVDTVMRDERGGSIEMTD